MPAAKTPTKTPTMFPESNVFWVDDADKPTSSAEQFGQSDDGRFTADQVMERFNITHKALEAYQALELVRPHRAGGLRTYSELDCRQIAFLVQEPTVATALCAIGKLIGSPAGQTRLEALGLARERCRAAIECLSTQQAGIDNAVKQFRRIDSDLGLMMKGLGGSPA